ncbi:MAG TPA: type III pantothenate kinase, partial [Chloroflexota bacterium]|nr:type III pantothenate kinase [Chloroflexota bacterium]
FDIGNAHVSVGVFDGHRPKAVFKLASDVRRPAEEYAFLLRGILSDEGISREDVDGVAIASVVPPLTDRFEQLAQRLFDCRPLVVGAGTRTGVHVAMHNPREVGTDRILNAAAGFNLFGGPLIVIDFGTATSFDVVGPDGAYAGSATAPGLALGAEALFQAASRLHRVDLARPKSAIGKDSASALQSGVILGHVAMVEGMVARIRAETGSASQVIATGELAPLIAAETAVVDHVEQHLSLIGLRLLYELNQEEPRPRVAASPAGAAR